jgi:hypothetical protein
MIICAFVYMVESAVAMKRGTTALNDVPLWGMRVSCGELPAITRCRRKESIGRDCEQCHNRRQ